MERIVKKWGMSLAVIIDAETAKIKDIVEGDVVEFEITKIKKVKKR